MKYPKPIYIEWADAIGNMTGWFDKDGVKEWSENTDFFIRMLGWLLEENKEFIVVALNYKPEDEFTQEQFCNLHKIPKTWIRKRKYIKDL